MTFDKYRRVLWRLEEMTPFIKPDIYSILKVDLAIMEEIGTHPRTLKNTKIHMRKLGLIARAGLGLWKINKSEISDYKYGSPKEEKGDFQAGLSDRVPTAYAAAEPETDFSIPRKETINQSDDDDELLELE